MCSNRRRIVLAFFLLVAALPGWSVTNDDRKRADTAVLLVADSTGGVRLVFLRQDSMTTIHDFVRSQGKWIVRGVNPPVSDLVGLSIDAETDAAKWRSVFGQSSPMQIGWPSFWNGWIQSLSELPEAQIISYRDKLNAERHILKEKLSPAEWEARKGRDFLGKLGVESSSAETVPAVITPAAGTLVAPDHEGGPKQGGKETDWRQRVKRILQITGIIAALVAIALGWFFRKRLVLEFRRRLLLLVDRICPAPPEAFTAEELLNKIHQHALSELLRSDRVFVDDRNLCNGAMQYALRRYSAVAAELMQHPLIPVTGDRKVAAEVAAFGEVVLTLIRTKSKNIGLEQAAEFLSTELNRNDDLEGKVKAAEDRAGKFDKELKDLRSASKKAGEEMAALLMEKKGEADKLSAEANELKKNINQKVEEEKERLRRAYVEKEAEFARVKTALEGEKKQATGRVTQLEREVAALRDGKVAAEGKASSLETTIKEERELHTDLKKSREALDIKMARIFQADSYLRMAQKSYWDRINHPASTGAILYNTYLGLFQASAGAAKGDTVLESVGWTNLMNLLQRLSQVPGLEGYQKDFGPICAGIKTIEVHDAVDSSVPEPERFIQTSVLQALFSGEVQFDGKQRYNLQRLRGWPLYFRVDQSGIWSAM